MMRFAPAAPGVVVLGLVLALSACASSPGPRGSGGPGPQPGLFVSPFGELFFSEPGRPWPVADWFAGADADSDGRITTEEFTADGARVLQTLDTRRDGRLTPDEVAVYEQSLARARARLPGMVSGQRGGQRFQSFSGGARLGLAAPAQQSSRRARVRAPTGPLAYGPIAAAGFFNYPQPIKAADLDTNQTVTAEEWSQATNRWFTALDADRDGGLTLAELPRTPLQQMMDRGPQ